jgi:hypothetical protein
MARDADPPYENGPSMVFDGHHVSQANKAEVIVVGGTTCASWDPSCESEVDCSLEQLQELALGRHEQEKVTRASIGRAAVLIDQIE